MWLGQAVVSTASGAVALALAKSGAMIVELVARAVIGGLIGLGGAFIFVLTIYLFRTPYKQRDEAGAEARRFEDWRIGLKQSIYRAVGVAPKARASYR